MSRKYGVFLLIIGVTCLLLALGAAKPPRRLSRASLDDKIRGGWAGQMIGVSYGAPTEFRYQGRIDNSELTWSPDRIRNALSQDDLYVDITFAEAIGRHGIDATPEEFGEAFRSTRYDLWHANAAARRNLNRGIPATVSGRPEYNLHANDIDFQIESDFIGLMTPGLPREANRLCDRIGRIMNYGDGLYGGMFVSGMYAAAFFEQDPRTVVERGLAAIPSRSAYGQVIRDVLDWSVSHPGDWQKVWQLIEDKWDRDDPCPKGALSPYNIDAKINGAYIALGLIYGGRDFGRTVEIATRAGQDSDCNPSSAGGILGVMLGYSGIPDSWKSGIPAIAESKFAYTESSFHSVSEATLSRALQMIERAGGRISGDEILVPYEEAIEPALEQWDPGAPAVIAPDDAAWKWQGDWKRDSGAMVAAGGDAKAQLTFEGAGIALVGPYSQDGGRADVYLDGEKLETLDAYVGPGTSDIDLWRKYNLGPGRHTLLIVPREDADARSSGKRIAITKAIAFRPR